MEVSIINTHLCEIVTELGSTVAARQARRKKEAATSSSSGA